MVAIPVRVSSAFCFHICQEPGKLITEAAAPEGTRHVCLTKLRIGHASVVSSRAGSILP
jgi:hypothetical protein